MSVEDHVSDRGGRWQRQPAMLWVYIALGVGRILLSGLDILVRKAPVKAKSATKTS